MNIYRTEALVLATLIAIGALALALALFSWDRLDTMMRRAYVAEQACATKCEPRRYEFRITTGRCYCKD